MTDLTEKAGFGGGAPDLDLGNDPFHLFQEWIAAAEKTEPNDANAMALATVDRSGMPNVRMVLLKGVDASGFTFYTNLESAKGEEILATHSAALCFHWKSQRRQVRIRGKVDRVSDPEADAYFATRPRDSQIGAWASKQSRKLESRFHLEREVAKFAAKFAFGTIERPPNWSGFKVVPIRFEFWRDRPFRLHDRLIFERQGVGQDWVQFRIFP